MIISMQNPILKEFLGFFPKIDNFSVLDPSDPLISRKI